MYMCSIWISYTITVLSVFNADLVVGQINNVLTGTRYNITIDFNPNDTAIFWIRDSTNLRDARVDTTTGYGCRSPLNFAPSRFNFYCENYGGRYILELDSSTDDKGIIYTTDTPSSPTFQYEVIDNDHTDAITCTNISAGFQLNETFTLTLSCTVTCTLQDTSITVYAKQNDTISPQLNTTSKIDACSSIGFQTITESSNLTLHVVRSLNITEQFTVVFNISHRGQFITRETSVITVSPAITTPVPTPSDCPVWCIIVIAVVVVVVVVIIGGTIYLCYCCGWFCFKKKVPDPPCNLGCSKQTCDSVTLEWVAPSDHCLLPLTGYVIEYNDSKSNDWENKTAIDAGVNRHVVEHLAPGEKYYFRISAENKVGIGTPATLDTPVTLSPMGTNGTSRSNPQSGNDTNANNSGTNGIPLCNLSSDNNKGAQR